MKRDCFKRCIGFSLYDDLLILEGIDTRYRNVINDLVNLRCSQCRMASFSVEVAETPAEGGDCEADTGEPTNS